MTPDDRLSLLRQRAAERERTMPDYPDAPGEIAEQAAVTEAMGPLQAVAAARRDHIYLSTACWHERHAYCSAMTGMQGAKRPATCKFCSSRCVCSCHSDESTTARSARAERAIRKDDAGHPDGWDDISPVQLPGL